MNNLRSLEACIEQRKTSPQEGSYTAYLFEQGLDKILKKVGEESTEVVIAAKNGDEVELVNEVCDLTYHLLVLLSERGVSLDAISEELGRRAEKIGNLKTFHQVDKNS